MSVDLVIPTLGRPSLLDLLHALDEQPGPLPGSVYLVDDRRHGDGPLTRGGIDPGRLGGRLRVLRSGGRGPAAARNLGWRSCAAEWVAFLDDDVLPSLNWFVDLASDIASAGPRVAASQGRLRVPLPSGRPTTDWERNVAGLQGARWITADMAYRRSVLEEVGGFDERFRRAFREDAELALRVTRAGYPIITGRRCVAHPVRPASPWVSVGAQAGNADDALMTILHGRGWHRDAASPPGRRPAHLAIAAAMTVGLCGALRGRRWLMALGLGAWAAGTAEFAWSRIAPGPKTAPEIATMVATSAVIPPLAVAQWAGGLWRWRGATPVRAKARCRDIRSRGDAAAPEVAVDLLEAMSRAMGGSAA